MGATPLDSLFRQRERDFYQGRIYSREPRQWEMVRAPRGGVGLANKPQAQPQPRRAALARYRGPTDPEKFAEDLRQGEKERAEKLTKYWEIREKYAPPMPRTKEEADAQWAQALVLTHMQDRSAYEAHNLLGIWLKRDAELRAAHPELFT